MSKTPYILGRREYYLVIIFFTRMLLFGKWCLSLSRSSKKVTSLSTSFDFCQKKNAIFDLIIKFLIFTRLYSLRPLILDTVDLITHVSA